MGDRFPRWIPLLDLRFADVILIFSETAEGAASLLDALITTLDKTGLKLNASKKVILTTEAQPPDHITTRAGHTIVVKDSFGTQKWLGCMLSALGSGNGDNTYHLQAAARAFHSNKWIFLDKNVSINSQMKLFEATVTPIACFAAGHRSIRQHVLHILDVEFRRLVRSVVGPPSGVCWSSPWHEILHEWNAREQQILEYTQHKSWGQTALSSLETGGLDCEPSTQSLGKTSIRMATACEKCGQETKHMGHKH